MLTRHLCSPVMSSDRAEQDHELQLQLALANLKDFIQATYNLLQFHQIVNNCLELTMFYNTLRQSIQIYYDSIGVVWVEEKLPAFEAAAEILGIPKASPLNRGIKSSSTNTHVE